MPFEILPQTLPRTPHFSSTPFLSPPPPHVPHTLSHSVTHCHTLCVPLSRWIPSKLLRSLDCTSRILAKEKTPLMSQNKKKNTEDTRKENTPCLCTEQPQVYMHNTDPLQTPPFLKTKRTATVMRRSQPPPHTQIQISQHAQRRRTHNNSSQRPPEQLPVLPLDPLSLCTPPLTSASMPACMLWWGQGA